ncbi:MAG: FGGY-family carbohydrate kinase, partial [Planctomycetota bacterium]
IMPHVLQAPRDCGGLLAIPFMDDEPALGIDRGGGAMLVGLNPDNATHGNSARAGLLATIFNLRLGSEPLDQQGYPRNKIVLSGGLTRTPELGQIVADVFRTPVQILAAAEEGTAWGAALLAKFRRQCMTDPIDWTSFLASQSHSVGKQLEPDATAAEQYDEAYARYHTLLETQFAFADER